MIGKEARLARGRPSSYELNAFFELLAAFWNRNMSDRAPTSRRLDIDIKGKRRQEFGFHAFARAAADDAGCTSKLLDRAIARAAISIRRLPKVAR